MFLNVSVQLSTQIPNPVLLFKRPISMNFPFFFCTFQLHGELMHIYGRCVMVLGYHYNLRKLTSPKPLIDPLINSQFSEMIHSNQKGFPSILPELFHFLHFNLLKSKKFRITKSIKFTNKLGKSPPPISNRCRKVLIRWDFRVWYWFVQSQAPVLCTPSRGVRKAGVLVSIKPDPPLPTALNIYLYRFN